MRRSTVLCMASLMLAFAACDQGGVERRDDPGTDVLVPTDAEEVTSADLPEATDPGPADPGGSLDTLVTPPYVPGRSFRFESAGRDGDRIQVRVVGRDFGSVFGIALRVEFDPAILELVGSTAEPIFDADGAGAVYRAAEIRPGQVALGLAHARYSQETELSGDRTIATLSFRFRKATAAKLSFYEARCVVVDRMLKKTAPVFLSATLLP